MTRIVPRWLQGLHLGGLLLAASLLPMVVFAAEPDTPHWARPSSVFVQHAEAARARATTVGATWDLAWTRPWAGGRLSSYVEASIGHWSAETPNGDRDTAAVSQFGLTPVLRWQAADSPWFFEGGIGLNLIGPVYRSGQKRFSTAFNFGDHLAVGYQWGERRQHELALRVQHFSNAGIKQPNPGEDFGQLRYSVRL
jgi:lipid A 3-O-deacylase